MHFQEKRARSTGIYAHHGQTIILNEEGSGNNHSMLPKEAQKIHGLLEDPQGNPFVSHKIVNAPECVSVFLQAKAKDGDVTGLIACIQNALVTVECPVDCDLTLPFPSIDEIHQDAQYEGQKRSDRVKLANLIKHGGPALKTKEDVENAYQDRGLTSVAPQGVTLSDTEIWCTPCNKKVTLASASSDCWRYRCNQHVKCDKHRKYEREGTRKSLYQLKEAIFAKHAKDGIGFADDPSEYHCAISNADFILEARGREKTWKERITGHTSSRSHQNLKKYGPTEQDVWRGLFDDYVKEYNLEDVFVYGDTPGTYKCLLCPGSDKKLSAGGKISPSIIKQSTKTHKQSQSHRDNVEAKEQGKRAASLFRNFFGKK